ncbi:permease [Shigella flexneri]
MLLLLVIKAKVQPFVALLLVSLLVALAAGIPAGEVGKVMIAGSAVLGSSLLLLVWALCWAYDRTLWWCRVTG